MHKVRRGRGAVGTTELIKSEYRGGSHWLCRVFEEESSDDKAEPDKREEASLWMNRGTQRPTRRNPLPARRPDLCVHLEAFQAISRPSFHA